MLFRSAHAEIEKLMPFLHLPVQAGNDRVLRAMNRSHTVDSYLRLLERVRRPLLAGRPDAAVPGVSSYRPWAVAAGIGAAYLAVIIHVSFALRARIGARWWRRVHYGSFAVLVGALAHGITAGSDRVVNQLLDLRLYAIDDTAHAAGAIDHESEYGRVCIDAEQSADHLVLIVW